MASYNENLGSMDGDTNGVTREYAVANGVTVTVGDLVYLSAGFITNASIDGKRLFGQVVGVQTNDLVTPGFRNTATGNAGGTVKVLVDVHDDNRYLMVSDEVGANLAATDVGKFFDVTGATGAQKIDVSTRSTTLGQMLCLRVNPGIRGTGATYGILIPAELQKQTEDIGAS